MSLQVGIGSLGGNVFLGGTPLKTIRFSYWSTGIDAQILAPKIGKYTFLYTGIFISGCFLNLKLRISKGNILGYSKLF